MLIANRSSSDTSPATKTFVSMNEEFLLELLFVRDTFGLHSDIVPASDSPTPVLVYTTEAEREELTEELDRRWTLGLQWMLEQPSRQPLIHEILETGNVDELVRVMPPRWELTSQEHFDRDAFTDWYGTLPQFDPARFSDEMLQDIGDEGLMGIIVLPISGSAAVVAPDGLQVTSWRAFTHPEGLNR